MALHSAEAILLAVSDLQDRDRIITFLTRERGKKKGVAKGARTRHSRFAGQLQPLAKVQVTWFEKDGADLVRISSVELVRAAGGLLDDLDDLLLGTYFADHLLEFAQEDEPSEAFFRLLDASVEALLAGVDRDALARYVEAWVLRLAGIFPAPRECPLCGRELREAGAVLPRGGDGLVCADCGGREGRAIAPAAVDFLLRIGRVAPAEVGELGVTPAALREVEALCRDVRRAFLQHELRSYAVLEQIRAAR